MVVIVSTVRLAIRAVDLVSETATVQPSWFFWQMLARAGDVLFPML